MSPERKEKDERPPFSKPKVFKSGIEAVHVSAAREMVQLHTRGRFPVRSSNESKVSSVTSSRDMESYNFQELEAKVSIPAKSTSHDCKNPRCDHCGQVVIPAPQSSFPIEDKPSISINDWSIFSVKKPILNAAEIDNFESILQFPCPEMIFGNSSLQILNHKNNFSIEFNAMDAFKSMEKSSQLKVSYHQEWLASRKSFSSRESMMLSKGQEKSNSIYKTKDLTGILELETLRPYDWTYTPKYKGTTKNIKFIETDETIPLEKLLRPDPMLFFDEMVLFEDELGDNGISILSAKIRVMPSCLLLLCRFFLRIDDVIFRIRDCRIYVDFDSNSIMREYKEQESSYEELILKVQGENKKDPKSLLRDSNWIASNIKITKATVEKGVLNS